MPEEAEEEPACPHTSEEAEEEPECPHTSEEAECSSEEAEEP